MQFVNMFFQAFQKAYWKGKQGKGQEKDKERNRKGKQRKYNEKKGRGRNLLFLSRQRPSHMWRFSTKAPPPDAGEVQGDVPYHRVQLPHPSGRPIKGSVRSAAALGAYTLALSGYTFGAKDLFEKQQLQIRPL